MIELFSWPKSSYRLQAWYIQQGLSRAFGEIVATVKWRSYLKARPFLIPDLNTWVYRTPFNMEAEQVVNSGKCHKA